jgi:hypothetical protein
VPLLSPRARSAGLLPTVARTTVSHIFSLFCRHSLLSVVPHSTICSARPTSAVSPHSLAFAPHLLPLLPFHLSLFCPLSTLICLHFTRRTTVPHAAAATNCKSHLFLITPISAQRLESPISAKYYMSSVCHVTMYGLHTFLDVGVRRKRSSPQAGSNPGL